MFLTSRPLCSVMCSTLQQKVIIMFYCDFLRKIPCTDGEKCFHATCNYAAISGRVAVESYFLVIHKNSRQLTTANLVVFRRETFTSKRRKSFEFDFQASQRQIQLVELLILIQEMQESHQYSRKQTTATSLIMDMKWFASVIVAHWVSCWISLRGTWLFFIAK